jgi:energy-coupling factor transporter ATP-binding protein EcfA2
LLPGKTLDSFDFDAVPMISKAHILALCAGDTWIEQGANLLLIGGPGGGKTHLASAIGLALVENGLRVLFARTSDLVQRLQVARRELALEAAINRLDRFHLLILDDLAYVSKDQAETSVLFELISARYERRSTLITANQPFGAWGKVFPDPAMTLAGSPRNDLRNQRRKLPPPRRTRTQTEGRRTATEARDNQGSRTCVAERQSNPNITLASDNQTEHLSIVAVRDSHPDCRSLSSRLSRYRWRHTRSKRPLSQADKRIISLLCAVLELLVLNGAIAAGCEDRLPSHPQGGIA